MSIRRQKRTKNFTVIPNEIFAVSLSMPALGLLTYLLSKPDDWQVSLTQLRREFRCGKDYLSERIRELEDRRYLRKHQVRLESGAWGEADYLVVDSPLPENPHPAENPQLPLAGLPATAQPSPANPPLLKTDVQPKTEEALNTLALEGGNSWSSAEAFEVFWKAYPSNHRVGKKNSRLEWDKLEVTQAVQYEIIQGLELWKLCDRWKRGFVVDPERFLKRHLWKDNPPAATMSSAEARAELAKADAIRMLREENHAGK